MRFYELSLRSVIARFYLLMAVVIVAGFLGAWALALLALPIFLSIMMGAAFTARTPRAATFETQRLRIEAVSGSPAMRITEVAAPTATEHAMAA